MSGRKHIVAKAVLYVIFPALLCPLLAEAQKISSSVNSSTFLNFSMPAASQSTQSSQSPATDAFDRPWADSSQQSDQSPDALSALKENKWITTAGVYAFSAAPEFYSPSASALGTGDWDSVLSGAMTAHLNRSNTSGLRMYTELESYGQKRQTGTAGEPGGQSLTMEWEILHVFPSKLGQFEIAGGPYQQRLVSYSAFANAPLTDVLLGYSASVAGFETSVTLPDKNLVFSLHQGTQHIGRIDKAHVTVFELSWTW